MYIVTFIFEDWKWEDKSKKKNSGKRFPILN